jgi:hypothetical protein
LQSRPYAPALLGPSSQCQALKPQSSCKLSISTSPKLVGLLRLRDPVDVCRGGGIKTCEHHPPACGPGSRVRQAAAEGVSETGVERDRVPSSGSRPTISGRSYTGPSKPEARRCRSGSTRGSRPGRRLTKRGARHTVDVRQRPASARRSTGLSICLFRRAQTQRRRARAGDQARLILSGQLTQVLRSFRRSYLR